MNNVQTLISDVIDNVKTNDRDMAVITNEIREEAIATSEIMSAAKQIMENSIEIEGRTTEAAKLSESVSFVLNKKIEKINNLFEASFKLERDISYFKLDYSNIK